MRYFTSDNLQKVSTGLDFLSSYNKAFQARQEGETNWMFGEISAEQLLRNATLRMNQGVREASQESYKGRVVQSDAIAQMAASGGGIDPLMLAQMKQRADYNSMSAIYDASMSAAQMRWDSQVVSMKARQAKRRGKAMERDILTGAFVTALTNWPRTGGGGRLSRGAGPGRAGGYRGRGGS